MLSTLLHKAAAGVSTVASPFTSSTTPAESRTRPAPRTPVVTITDTEQSLVVIADMPGVEPGHSEVTLDHGVLTVSGRVTRGDDAVQGLRFLHQERAHGDFLRSFQVPPGLDAAKISASLAHGVLRVVLPKAEKAQPRRIPITQG